MGYGGYGFRYCEDLAAPTLQLGRNAFGAKPQFTDLRLSLILHISHLGARFQKWWHDTQSEESDWVYGSPARFHSNFPTEMGSSANWVPHSIPWSSKIPLSPSYVAWGYLSPLYFLGTQQPSSHEASNIKALGPRILGRFLDAIPWTLRVKNTPVALNFCCDVAMG